MLNTKLNVEMDSFVNAVPEKVVRNTLWDITVLLMNNRKAKKAFEDVANNPSDFTTCSHYFENTFGMLRLYDFIIESKETTPTIKANLEKLRLAYKNLDKLGSPILDKQKKNKEVEKMVITLYGAIDKELTNIWVEFIGIYGVEEQLKSFKDRDMSEYVKNIIGYTPGNFSDARETVVKEFVNLVFQNYIENA
jgi:hypothetical protein